MRLAIAPNAFSDDDTASDQGSVVRSFLADQARYRHGSAADWWPTLEGAFAEIEAESSSSNWDGEGALPVSKETQVMARWVVGRLFWLLPSGTPPPDAVGEADGEICFSWEVGKRRYFIVSVGQKGNLSFTARFGAAGGQHGWRQLDAKDARSTQQSIEDVARLVARAHESDAAKGTP